MQLVDKTSAYFTLGLVARRDYALEEAETQFIQARDLWLKGDSTHLHPFIGACNYKLGAVCLDQGKAGDAV